MGMKPGQYLFYLYSAILLAVLFFILVFPGLRNSGSVVSFDSAPEETSVWMDGQYVGATPCSSFIPEGKHKFVFRKEGYRDRTEEKEIGGRIFASLIFPAKDKIETNLEPDNPDKILEKGFLEFSEWGLINSFSGSYQPEPVLEMAARSVPAELRGSEKVQAFIKDSIRNVYSSALLEDYINAYRIINGSTEGIPITEAHLGQCRYKGTESISPKADLPLAETRENRTGDMNVLGMTLTEVPGGTYILGNKAKSIPTESAPALYTKKTERVYISEQVTVAQFRAFTEAGNKWSRENIRNLMAEKLVTDMYLKPNQDLSKDENPVTYISWHAAEAYCAWLTEQLPVQLKEKYMFRLPTEYEWEAWARSSEGRQTVWDWCGNWYFPADTFYEGTAPFDGAERAVRGGSWMNDKGTVSVWSRGCQPPDWCTPVLGFRVVLAGK